MKKIFFVLISFLSLTCAFAQVKDNTGNANPFSNLSQKSKNYKLYSVLSENYSNEELARAKTLVKLLLDSGADPNYTESYPVLFYAVIDQNFEFVKLLTDAGADVNALKYDQTPVITEMIKKNYSVTEVEYILKKGARPFDSKIQKTDDPVINAIHTKNLEMIKLLVKYGADIKKINNSYNETTLELAARENSFDIVKYLIEIGIKPSDLPKYSIPPVYYSLRNQNFAMAEFLLSNGDNINKPINIYSKSSKSYLFHELFDERVYDHDYLTFNDGSIKKMLELGADPYLKDDYGMNAFEKAVYLLYSHQGSNQRVQNILELLNNGYIICPNPKYKKSLPEAVATGDTEAVKAALKNYKVTEDTGKIFSLGYGYNIKNIDKNIQLILDSGIKPSYISIIRSIRDGNNQKYSQKLASHADLLGGSDDWKYDFISYANSKIFVFSDSKLLKGVVNTALDNGMNFDTMIHNEDANIKEMPLLFYIVNYDKTKDCSGIQALLDRGADINQVWNGKRLIDSIKPSNKNHDFLMTHGAKVYN